MTQIIQACCALASTVIMQWNLGGTLTGGDILKLLTALFVVMPTHDIQSGNIWYNKNILKIYPKGMATFKRRERYSSYTYIYRYRYTVDKN